MRGRVTFDWRFDESAQAEPLPAPPPAPKPRRWGRLTALLLVLGITLGAGGVYVVRQAEHNLAQVEAQVAEAALLESWNNEPSGRVGAIRRSLGDTVEIAAVELQDRYALVEVDVTATRLPWSPVPYRVARVFVEAPDGWRAAPPHTELWGPRRTLATTYFDIEYGQRDAAAVAAVAATLDDFYRNLHTDLGLAPDSTRLAIRIAVVPGADPEITDIRTGGGALIVSPPDLIPRPIGVDDATVLRQSIAFPLAFKVFDALRGRTAVPCEWQALVEGVGLWQRWHDSPVPSRRHYQYQRKIDEWLLEQGTPPLDLLIAQPQECWHRPPYLETRPTVNGRVVPRGELASTLISYLVSAYGRETLPRLMTSLPQHSEWATLSTELVGLAPPALEAEWHAHLRAATTR